MNWKYFFFCLFETILKCNYNILKKKYLFIAISFYLFIAISQYCASKCLVWIRPKRHFDKKIFFLQNIVVTFKNTFKLGFYKHDCPKINIFNSHRKKILDEICLFIFLLQYILSQYCVQNYVWCWPKAEILLEALFMTFLTNSLSAFFQGINF